MNIKQKTLSIIIGLFLSSFSILYAQSGRIYGKIVDANTGECLSNVTVSLILEGSSTESQSITKEDGAYTFDITPKGNYQLKCKKPDYDNFSYASFYVRAGESLRKDVPLQKPPQFLRITELGKNDEIDALNIGALTVSDVYYVDFVNFGGVDINFVTSKMCEWITEVTPSSGTLKPIGSDELYRATIKIKIDPDKFEAGKTTGKVLIITNNGNKVLNIKAVGKFPEIKTLALTTAYNDPQNKFPDTFRSEIKFNGRHTFKEIGYCFSDVNKNPTINDNVVLANDAGNYDYKDYWMFGLTGKHLFPWLDSSELFDPDFACRTYYVRTFLKYDNENNVVLYSNNVAQFTLWEILCK
jgi:hypothetical protein